MQPEHGSFNHNGSVGVCAAIDAPVGQALAITQGLWKMEDGIPSRSGSM
jgi:hypothetical protein